MKYKILLLGIFIPLEIIYSKIDIKPKIMISNKITLITVKNANIKTIFNEWYRVYCLKFINKRVDYYSKKIKKKPIEIRVKNQRTIWGSCSSNDRLNFTWKVILLPIELINYIVVHEMCHLIFLNHSKNFWDCLENILPDYKTRVNGIKKWEEKIWKLGDFIKYEER